MNLHQLIGINEADMLFVVGVAAVTAAVNAAGMAAHWRQGWIYRLARRRLVRRNRQLEQQLRFQEERHRAQLEELADRWAGRLQDAAQRSREIMSDLAEAHRTIDRQQVQIGIRDRELQVARSNWPASVRAQLEAGRRDRGA